MVPKHIESSPLKAPTAVVKDLPLVAKAIALPSFHDEKFDLAIQTIFQHEGVLSIDKDDPGGITKWGISLRAARSFGDLDGDGLIDLDIDGDGDVDADDIRALSPAEAAKAYFYFYWKPNNYSHLSDSLATKMFDLGVNMGPRQAGKLLQRAVRACSTFALVEDGIIGRATLTAVETIYQPALLTSLRSEAAGFYRVLVATNPKSKKYINGWLKRAYF